MKSSKYSTLIKVLALLPVLCGLLIFSELFLPAKTVKSTITYKSANQDLKTSRYTYTLETLHANDQFSKTCYDSFKRGEQVQLEMTPFTREINQILSLETQTLCIKDTWEKWFLYGFGIFYLLAGLVWFKKGKALTSKEVKWALFPIFLSLGTFFRIVGGLF